ncbi:WXG100 family type VII secretion target [Streptomyces mirabilis]|uniref:WXG100 family type VII secretion target n=1 Tax=Streptomyces mirabilis TaxID=68239 RepID=UPI001BAF8D8D|nr:WXG100 family type VII secretion target [Streptomyces mirabilis]QUW79198.1 WXG100 family type VII secretion target [Streptomyces mirabilis]
MSGDDKAPKELTDQQRVDVQVGQVDALSGVSNVMHDAFGFKRVRLLTYGKVTDFEDHQLNAMIDLVHQANPADLEHAGVTLAKASKAINEAAAELRRHLQHAGEDWQGEAGKAFQKWGEGLATHTESLATYADGAGVQVTAAATGLASVRGSLPSRDTRPALDQKKPEQLPVLQQFEGNKQYAEAVQVEKDRQEAINQMNRLASFYSVSGSELAKLQKQDPPVFEAMPSVGVPDPYGSHSDGADGSTGNSNPGSAHRAVASASGGGHLGMSGDASGNRVLASGHPGADANVELHRPTVGTEINSVGTLPPEAAKPTPVTPTPSVTGPNGPSGAMAPPMGMGTGTVPPAFGGPVARAVGLGGAAGGRTPGSAQGRVTTSEGTTAGGRTGRGPAGPIGRASAVGQQAARGPASATGRSPMGRGVTGGMPRSAGTTGSRTGGTPGGRVGGVPGQPAARTGPGATGAARTGGVVGGRPTSEVGPSATGARVPRGTVIGGEGATGARTTGERPGQRGVIGANNPVPGTGQGQSQRRSPGNADSVVGAPSSRAGGRGNGAASGGSGLVSGSAEGRSPDRAAGGRTQRQQHSAEDKKSSRDDARRGDAPSATD